MRRPFSAYDGDEAYLFVSYSHADSRQVYAELEALRKDGLNIWYDEGISPGSRWTDDLADRLAEADLVLVYMSPNFVQSEHCRNEIDFAIEQGRRILLVYLEPAELPRGMKLMLSGRQAIFRNEHGSSAYAQKLRLAISTLMSTDGLVQTSPALPSRRGRRWRLGLAAASLFVLTALMVIFGYQRFDAPIAETRSEPLPLLIANFENHTGQAVFDGALEEALKIGLEGAPFITSFPRSNALRILDQISGGKVLTQEAARLVATQQGLELVLAGDVERQGSNYHLVVEGVDPLTGDQRILASETAESPLDALSAIASLSRDLRSSLGDLTTEESHLDEVFTSSSLEAVVEFAAAQALAAEWKHEAAVTHYEQSTILDENFGRAWGGWAYSAWELGQREKSRELWDKCLSLLNTMTERERLRTLGIYYVTHSANLEKAIETYETLLAAYPADAAGYNNLAVALFSSGRFAEAKEAGGNLLEIYPKSLLYRANYALYAMYAGDMETATTQAEATLAEDAGYYLAHLPLVMARLLESDYVAAAESYVNMASAGAAGRALSLLGQMDMSLGRGDYAKVTADWQSQGDVLEADANASAIARLMAVRAALAQENLQDAHDLLAGLSMEHQSDRSQFELGEIYVEMRFYDQALAIAESLSDQVSLSGRAHAELLRGLVAHSQGDLVEAIDHFNASLDLRDLWSTHYHLGKAYLAVGHAVEAMDELDLAENRRGESLAAFLDDKPTYWRLVELPYWRGQAQQALGINGNARASYAEYLRRRDLEAGSRVLQVKRYLSLPGTGG